jgi:hypothetical protein
MSFGGGNLFSRIGWGRRTAEEPIVQEKRERPSAAIPANNQRIISFRIDADLDRKLSRELSIRSESRSDFIRSAIDRALQQDAKARLRAAHSAITWD